MLDWRALIAGHLGVARLSSEEHDEVVTELANHLQDFFEAALSAGVAEAEAIQQALQELGNTDRLGFRIYAAKHEEDRMNQRTKSFWLPGLITLTGSLGWLLILQSRNWPISGALFHAAPPVTPFVIWICTLPIFGALGTYLSKRAGGSIQARLGVAGFPSIVMMGLLVSVLLFASFVERNPFVREHSAGVILIFLPWVVLPAIALLTGSLVLQAISRRDLTSR